MSEESILATIQLGAAEEVAANPYFSDITVLTELIGDIENQIALAIGSLGVVVLVVTPTANVLAADAPGPYFDDIKLVCRVIENVIVNQGDTGTKKRALAIAEHILAILHLFRPEGVSETISADKPTVVLVAEPSGLLVYDIRFRTNGGLSYTVPSMAHVTAAPTVNPHEITLACATPGAAIFYTLDGTFPHPRSNLYTGPITGTVGQTVIAKGWLSGYVWDGTVLRVAIP